MADEQDPPEDLLDPTEDTPEPELEDTADADSQADWTPKDRKEASRKVSEQGREIADLRKQLELLRSGGDDADDADVDAGDDGPPTRYEADSWQLAETVYGPEALAAYDAFYPLYEKAETPADVMAALMAFHRGISGEAAPEGGDAPPAPGNGADPTAPRVVDPNRSDGPDSDEKIAEARKSGKLGDYASAAIDAMFPRKRG